MKHLLIKSALLLFTTGLLLTSCRDKETDPNIIAATDNANAQSAFDDMARMSEDALNQNNGGARLAAGGNPISCATVQRDTLATDSTRFTITFSGTCIDGKLRSGTIVAVLDGDTYNTPGATLTITSSGANAYSVNGNKLEGKKVVTCSTSTIHKIVVSDIAGTGYAKITHADGKLSQWKSSRTRTLVSGSTTPLLLSDNVYLISETNGIGNPVVSGINREGVAYTVDFINPIKVDFTCPNNSARYPTQGVVKVTPAGKDALAVDYGDGTCDNAVKITYKGKTYDRTLNY